MIRSLFYILIIILSTAYVNAAIPNDGIDDSKSIENMIMNSPPGSTISLKTGTYDICSKINIKNIKDITIIGNGLVEFKKCSSFNDEYILYIIDSEKITIENISFWGLTTQPYIDSDNTNIVWGEQGVLFSGTQNSAILNSRFYNFGDAALRVTSSKTHPSEEKINSRHFLAQGNIFHNVTQVTTTHVWSNDFGGTEDITFKHNLFSNMKGGLKLSSRKPVSQAVIESNIFSEIHGSAIEMNYYSKLIVQNNVFNNIGKFILNAYPNSINNINEAINWNNLTFSKNQIINAKGGIRIVSDIPGELVDSKYVSGILIALNTFVNVDMSVYGSNNKYYNIINMLTNGEKKFIFSVIKNNIYQLPKNVGFFNSLAAPEVILTDNIELSSPIQ
uniref:right-handed parallel beta-helix repeat-containing protein n=1 Tax=Vibrio anguillarum TaxID=55601 RepID=UPI004048942D